MNTAKMLNYFIKRYFGSRDAFFALQITRIGKQEEARYLFAHLVLWRILQESNLGGINAAHAQFKVLQRLDYLQKKFQPKELRDLQQLATWEYAKRIYNQETQRSVS
ncbi:hypothetical protein [Helicobacter cynogastricus]|uniref:OMP1697 n=1 Tax=Helicobacter cynogastricus TaxID=329937 RepID=A0A1R3UCV5_9HELI|nr:hypothetical protein [Helicobacter cynogastricus]SFZ72176.1 OMP1697 [Helicobacter cynogastricus]